MTKIKNVRKKSQLKTIKVEGDFREFIDLSRHLVDNHYNTLMDEYVSKIETAYNENLDTVQIVNIIINDDQKIILANPRKNWLTSLDEALKYFERQENFQKCIKVNALIEKISADESIRV